MNTQPKMLSSEELCRLAEKMCAATDPKEVDQLVKEMMEGFYGRHMRPEELHLSPPSRGEDREVK